MITSSRLILAALMVMLLPLQAVAVAPVVDESENFALLEGPSESIGLSDAPRHQDLVDSDEEQPLAHDNGIPISSNAQNTDAMFVDKIQGLQQEVQELRGQLEIQAHELKALKDQQLAFYKDLDARLGNAPKSTAGLSTPKAAPLDIEASAQNTAPISSGVKAKTSLEAEAAGVSPKVIPVSASAQNNPAEEQISYFKAYELIKNKQYDDALSSMQSFVNQYPKSPFTANAQYWLGELYMVKKEYPEAIHHFGAVVNQYPSSSRSAASMLKIGYALAASGKQEEAKQQLQQVVKSYPDTNTAHLATMKLESFDS